MTRILVVDDEAVARDVTVRVLRNAGLEVLEARNGGEGLALARRHVPDLVLVDVNLPDIDGLEVARQLKADPALGGVYVVHLSSSRTSPDDQTQGLDAGADGYIARPIANRELLARVNAFLRLKQVTDALRRSEAQTRLLLEQSADAGRRLEQLNAELQEKHKRLEEAQAVARMGSWNFDLTTGKVVWSAEMYRIFGVDAETYQPTPPCTVPMMHPDDRAAVHAALEGSLALEGPQSIEHRIVLPGGGIKTIEERWQVFRNAEGLPVRALGTCTDITEQKQAEEATRASQSLVETAGRMARLGAWAVELTSLRLHWSDVVADIHDKPAGFTPSVEQAINFYAPEYQNLVREHFARCVAGGEPFYFEAEIITAAGRRRWVRTVGQAERDAAERVVTLRGAFQDISDRKAAERATRELAERLQKTLESITDAFFTLDAQWRFTFLNQRAQQVMRQGADVLLGREIWAVFPQLVGSVAQQEYERAVREGVATSFESHYAPSNRWFEVTAYPSDQGLGVYFREVTDRKKDQEALRELNAELEARVLARTAELNQAREEAELASRAKSDFLATMSHEIRTPLNGVVGMVDVLHQTSLLGHQAEMVDLIRDSAQSLLGIVEDILDFSKIEAGRLDLVHAPLRVADMVEAVCGMLDPTAIKRNVQLALFVDPSIPLLLSDEARLRQVLVNLLGNAIKFSSGRDTHGRVAVRARLKSCDAETATVELTVVDNGIGMDEATVARLFTRFMQGDVSTTRHFGGTGLGLAISSNLLKLMGGEISVRSAVGKGAAFSVVLTLPRAEGEVPTDPAAALVRGLRCCIIGSDMPLGDDLAAYLRWAGVSVERASEPWMAGPAGVWLVLPSQAQTSIETLRDLARSAGSPETRFLLLGSGYRRRPRVDAEDLVLLDHWGLTRRSLYRALALASGRLAADAFEGGIGERPQRSAATAAQPAPLQKGRQILVAEDNETNRELIRRQLQLFGREAEFAEDGQRALELWRSGDFALVLTDLRMPRMDGYALAAAIRAEEQIKGAQRTAIVALSANALQEEELRCRAAGMDAFLSKPVALPRLQAAVEEWLPASAGIVGGEVNNRSTPATPTAALPAFSPGAPMAGRLPVLPPVDLTVLKGLVGDDEAVIADVLRAFQDSAREFSAVLTQAGTGSDLHALAEAAHKLKAAASSIGAERLGDGCSQLESVARAGQSESVTPVVSHLKEELAAVSRYLQERGGPC